MYMYMYMLLEEWAGHIVINSGVAGQQRWRESVVLVVVFVWVRMEVCVHTVCTHVYFRLCCEKAHWIDVRGWGCGRGVKE